MLTHPWILANRPSLEIRLKSTLGVSPQAASAITTQRSLERGGASPRTTACSSTRSRSSRPTRGGCPLQQPTPGRGFSSGSRRNRSLLPPPFMLPATAGHRPCPLAPWGASTPGSLARPSSPDGRRRLLLPRPPLSHFSIYYLS